MKRIVYSEKAIGLATFIGGPISGTVLIALNFSALKKSRFFWGTLILGLAYTLLVIGMAMMIPDSIGNSFGMVISAANAALLYWLVTLLQKKDIDNLVATEEAKTSHWATAGYTVGGLAVTLSIVFGMALSAPPDGYSGSVAFSKGKIFYSNGVDKDDVSRICQYFDKSPFMAEFNGGELVMIKEGDKNILKFIFQPPLEELMADSAFRLSLLMLEQEISIATKPSKKVEIAIINPELTTTVVINPKYREYIAPKDGYFIYPTTNRHRLLAENDISLEIIREISMTLASFQLQLPSDGSVEMILEEKIGTYILTAHCTKEVSEKPELITTIKRILEGINNSGIVNDFEVAIDIDDN